jgi:hypothetical protein
MELQIYINDMHLSWMELPLNINAYLFFIELPGTSFTVALDSSCPTNEGGDSEGRDMQSVWMRKVGACRYERIYFIILSSAYVLHAFCDGFI